MHSMTGFSVADGEASGRRWRWEVRSVNGRGLDIRFRLADTLAPAEEALRGVIAKHISRGSLTVQLWDEAARDGGALQLNREALVAVVYAMGEAKGVASAAGVKLGQSGPADVLGIKGVMEKGTIAGEPDEKVKEALIASFDAIIAGLAASRAQEGARQCEMLSQMMAEIEALVANARLAYDAQHEGAAEKLKAKLAELGAADVDPDRLAQEVALIAVKGDVREELDRLTSHIAAARDLISAEGPVGRKLDFLTQEFNREVNTLCSKSGSAELTRIGLAMKVAVDQVREQAQNVE